MIDIYLHTYGFIWVEDGVVGTAGGEEGESLGALVGSQVKQDERCINHSQDVRPS